MISINYDLLGKVARISIEINEIYYPLPWNKESRIMNWEEISYPPTRESLQIAWENYILDKDINVELVDRPDLVEPLLKLPDWESLQNRLIKGDLRFIFDRLSIESMKDNAVSTATSYISDAILSVKLEQSLNNSLQLLIQKAGYQFMEQEKSAWNNAVLELNFSDLVKI